MNKFLLISILTILEMSQSTSQVNKDCFGNYPEDLSKMSESELGKAFRYLKKLNISNCDNYNSDLQRIMNELADRLREQNISTKKLESIMGKPDSNDDKQKVVKLNAGEEIWIYKWRGWHDWLYFVVEKGIVKRVEWWFAFE